MSQAIIDAIFILTAGGAKGLVAHKRAIYMLVRTLSPPTLRAIASRMKDLEPTIEKEIAAGALERA
jgi:hypothetical protein